MARKKTQEQPQPTTRRGFTSSAGSVAAHGHSGYVVHVVGSALSPLRAQVEVEVNKLGFGRPKAVDAEAVAAAYQKIYEARNRVTEPLQALIQGATTGASSVLQETLAATAKVTTVAFNNAIFSHALVLVDDPDAPAEADAHAAFGASLAVGRTVIVCTPRRYPFQLAAHPDVIIAHTVPTVRAVLLDALAHRRRNEQSMRAKGGKGVLSVHADG